MVGRLPLLSLVSSNFLAGKCLEERKITVQPRLDVVQWLLKSLGTYQIKPAGTHD